MRHALCMIALSLVLSKIFWKMWFQIGIVRYWNVRYISICRYRELLPKVKRSKSVEAVVVVEDKRARHHYQAHCFSTLPSVHMYLFALQHLVALVDFFVCMKPPYCYHSNTKEWSIYLLLGLLQKYYVSFMGSKSSSNSPFLCFLSC